MPLTSLVVCADGGIVDVLRPILEELELQVEHCLDEQTGHARLTETGFDVVFVDFANPDEAAALLKTSRASSFNRKTLVVALVGSENDVRQIFSLGTNFVLYKPISAERARSSLRAARSLMRRERRRSPRAQVNAKTALTYANIEDGQATLIVLSEEGTLLQSERKLPPCCKVYFQFNLPGNPTLVRLSGELVWQDSAGRVGMRFVDVPQASRRVLRDWLQKSLSQASPLVSAKPILQAPAVSSAREAETPAERADAGLARLRATPGNRRGPSRHACRVGADVFRLGKAVPHRCSLSDISTGGCYIEMPSPFPPGQAVEILVRTNDVKLRVQGVVQAVHTGFGMGVQFELKTQDDRDQVQHLIRLLAEAERDTSVGTGDHWLR